MKQVAGNRKNWKALGRNLELNIQKGITEYTVRKESRLEGSKVMGRLRMLGTPLPHYIAGTDLRGFPRSNQNKWYLLTRWLVLRMPEISFPIRTSILNVFSGEEVPPSLSVSRISFAKIFYPPRHKAFISNSFHPLMWKLRSISLENFLSIFFA